MTGHTSNKTHLLSKMKTKIYLLALLLLLAIGLYGSLKVVLGNFGIEPDSSHSLLIWQGISTHGFDWIKDWLFTQDNWTLSLIPFHFLGYLLFGPKLSIALVFGWLIFVASAFISGAIAWRLGAKKSSIIITVLLLNLGSYAHTNGFASYATSHNMTNLFGLLSIWLLLGFLGNKKTITYIIYTIAFAIILISGAVSDPWMLAAYNLPILIVASISILKPTLLIQKNVAISILLCTLISFIAVKTKLFGILYFLPSMHFIPGDWDLLNENTIFLIKDLGGLLNMSPVGTPSEFLPSMISIFLIFILLLYVAIFPQTNRNPLGKNIKIFFSISFLAISGIIAAFIISNVPAALYSGRFLLNCAYLLVITICILVEINWNYLGTARIIYIFSAVIFLASSFSSNYNDIKSTSFQFRDTGVYSLIDFLKSNGLSYGYGPYWGTNANTVTLASAEEVIIRPVTFNKSSGMLQFTGRPQTSSRWYVAQDIPDGIKESFVIVKSDIEECPDIQLCLDGLNRQFGQPSRSLTFGDATIQIWTHKLIGYSKPIRVILNHRYEFSFKGEYPGTQGWATPESWGVWSEGSNATLVLQLSDKNTNALWVEANPLVNQKHPEQTVEVQINGMNAGKYVLRAKGPFTVPIPEECKQSDKLRVEFHLPDAVSPKELGINSDPRKLALGLISLTPQSLPLIAAGERLPFSASNPALIYLNSGWSTPEPWGTWSEETTATLMLPLHEAASSLLIEANPLVNQEHPEQTVEVQINGIDAGKYVLRIGGPFTVPIPKECKQSDKLRVDFHFPAGVSPKELGINADTRKLALGLIAITVQ